MRRVLPRVAGVAAVLGAAAAVTVASHTRGLTHVTRYVAAYSPARLEAGRLWTVPASALLLGHPRAIGVTSVMIVLLFLPFALLRGVGRALATGLTGHVTATLVVAVGALVGSALGAGVATSVAHQPDYGASAFLAACAGGLAVWIAGRRRLLGLALLTVVAAFFAVHLVSAHAVTANVSDVEHLVALGTGALVEWRVLVAPTPSTALSRRRAAAGA